MSQQLDAHKTKKRKHAASASTSASATAAGAAADEPSSKRPKKEKHAKEHKKAGKRDKGKARATDDAFRVVRASLTVSVPPKFAQDLRGGVEELLDSMLMRCVRVCVGLVGVCGVVE